MSKLRRKTELVFRSLPSVFAIFGQYSPTVKKKRGICRETPSKTHRLRPIFCQKPTHGVNTARANPLPEIVPTHRRVGTTSHTAKSIDFSLRSVFETTRFALLARRAERCFFFFHPVFARGDSSIRSK